jgi:hypothetical protein
VLEVGRHDPTSAHNPQELGNSIEDDVGKYTCDDTIGDALITVSESVTIGKS